MSCSTSASISRRLSVRMVSIRWSLMEIWPRSTSQKRIIRRQSVDLPDPLLPAIPTMEPLGISTVTLSKILLRPYENDAFLAAAPPKEIVSPSLTSSTTGSSSSTSMTRCAAARVPCRVEPRLASATAGPNEPSMAAAEMATALASTTPAIWRFTPTKSSASEKAAMAASAAAEPVEPTADTARCAPASLRDRSSSVLRRDAPTSNCRTSVRPRKPSSTKVERPAARSRTTRPPFPETRKTMMGTTAPTTSWAASMTKPSCHAKLPVKATMTTSMSAAIQTGEIVCAKKTSSSSMSEVSVEMRLPRSTPDSRAGARRRRLAKTSLLMWASSLKAM